MTGTDKQINNCLYCWHIRKAKSNTLLMLMMSATPCKLTIFDTIGVPSKQLAVQN